MQGGSAFADDGDYPISGGGGDPQCEASGGGAVVETPSAGGTDDGCWSPTELPGNPAPSVGSRVPSTRQEALPATGTDVDDLLRLGGITLLAGAGLLAVTRRRRDAVPA